MAVVLDEKDKRILLELDLDARASLKAISRKARLSKEAVLYRIKRLEERGIIQRYLAIINFSRVGYTGFGVFCRLEGADEEKRRALIEWLKAFPQVYWVGICGGRFDVSFGLMCKSVFEFNRLYYQFKNEFSGMLSETAVAIRAELRQFTRNYLLKEAKTTEGPSLFFGQEPSIEEIDELDSEIMSLMAADAKTPVVEIASRLHKPPSTIALRIKRLEEKGIIQAYDIVVKVQAYGLQSYRLLLTLNKLDEQLRNRLFSFAQENPRIGLAAETVGGWNFEIILETESHLAFEEELTKLKRIFGNAISGLEVLVMFDEDHYLNMWPVKKAGAGKQGK